MRCGGGEHERRVGVLPARAAGLPGHGLLALFDQRGLATSGSQANQLLPGHQALFDQLQHRTIACGSFSTPAGTCPADPVSRNCDFGKRSRPTLLMALKPWIWNFLEGSSSPPAPAAAADSAAASRSLAALSSFSSRAISSDCTTAVVRRCRLKRPPRAVRAALADSILREGEVQSWVRAAQMFHFTTDFTPPPANGKFAQLRLELQLRHTRSSGTPAPRTAL